VVSLPGFRVSIIISIVAPVVMYLGADSHHPVVRSIVGAVW